MPSTRTPPSISLARWFLALHGIGALFILLILVAISLGLSDSYRWTADLAALSNPRPFDGLLSNLGMIVWASASAIAAFTGLLKLRASDLPPAIPRLLLMGALATFVLLVDDFFMFHDAIFPDYIGIPETVATIMVGIVPLAFLWFSRNAISRTPWPLLAAGAAYLALMTVIDFMERRVEIPGHHLWEEGAKFLGILHWCGYFVLTSTMAMLGEMRASRDGTAVRAFTQRHD